MHFHDVVLADHKQIIHDLGNFIPGREVMVESAIRQVCDHNNGLRKQRFK
jgi:hypothetical protein